MKVMHAFKTVATSLKRREITDSFADAILMDVSWMNDEDEVCMEFEKKVDGHGRCICEGLS